MKIFIKMMFNFNIINQENPNLKNKTRSVISETSRWPVFKGHVEKALSSLEEGLTTLTKFSPACPSLSHSIAGGIS